MKHPQPLARVNFRPSLPCSSVDSSGGGSVLLQHTPINVKEKRSNRHERSKTTLRVAPVYIRELGISFSLDRRILAAVTHTHAHSYIAAAFVGATLGAGTGSSL